MSGYLNANPDFAQNSGKRQVLGQLDSGVISPFSSIDAVRGLGLAFEASDFRREPPNTHCWSTCRWRSYRVGMECSAGTYFMRDVHASCGFFAAQPTRAALAAGSRPFPVYMTQATLAIRETSGYHRT